MQCEFQAEVVGGRHSISSLFLSISLSHFYTLELVHTRWFVFFPGVQMLTVIVLRHTDGTWSLAGGEQTNLHEHTWKLMGKRNAVVCIWFWWPRGICFLFFTFHILLELLEVLNVPLTLGGCTIWPRFSYDLEMIPCRVQGQRWGRAGKNSECIYGLFLLSDVGNERESSSDQGQCVWIESLVHSGKHDGVRALQISR